MIERFIEYAAIFVLGGTVGLIIFEILVILGVSFFRKKAKVTNLEEYRKKDSNGK